MERRPNQHRPQPDLPIRQTKEELKPKEFEWRLSLHEVFDEALSGMAQERGVSPSSVLRMLIERGVQIEDCLLDRQSDIFFKWSGGKEVNYLEKLPDNPWPVGLPKRFKGFEYEKLDPTVRHAPRLPGEVEQRVLLPGKTDRELIDTAVLHAVKPTDVALFMMFEGIVLEAEMRDGARVFVRRDDGREMAWPDDWRDRRKHGDPYTVLVNFLDYGDYPD